MRSPWTGNPKNIEELHTVELCSTIRSIEELYNLKPLRMTGWTIKNMQDYLRSLMN